MRSHDNRRQSHDRATTDRPAHHEQEARQPLPLAMGSPRQDLAQGKLQAIADNSPRVKQLASLQVQADNAPRVGKVQQLQPLPEAGGLVQRVVEKVRFGSQVYFRSSFDTAKLFSTSDDAEQHEVQLIAEHRFPSYKKRSPTAFTFAHTPSDNTIGDGGSRQGPHVYAESGMNRAFEDMDADQLSAAAMVLPKPDVNAKRFRAEMHDLSDDDERKERIDRYDERYRQLHGLAQTITPHTEKGPAKRKVTTALRNVVKMAANMTAHGTYGYQVEAPDEHEDWQEMLAGKGERADAPAAALFDAHSGEFVNDDAARASENSMRRSILGHRKGVKKKRAAKKK